LHKEKFPIKDSSNTTDSNVTTYVDVVAEAYDRYMLTHSAKDREEYIKIKNTNIDDTYNSVYQRILREYQSNDVEIQKSKTEELKALEKELEDKKANKKIEKWVAVIILIIIAIALLYYSYAESKDKKAA